MILLSKDVMSATAAQSTLRNTLRTRPVYWVLAYAVCLHMALFAYDLIHPETFVRADRANERLAVIQSFVAAWPSGSDLLELLRTNGIVGDYLFHLLGYVVGGQYGVIGFQVALMLYSLFALFQLALILTASPRVALIAPLLYLHLPHTLVLPHQLTTEALFVPAIVISTYFTVRYILDSRRFRDLALAGLLLGIATLVRPIAVLWPMIVAGVCVIARARVSVRHIIGFIALSMFPIGLWLLTNYALSGQITLGESRHDLGHNLYGRVSRIAASLSTPAAAQIRHAYLASDDRSLGLVSYIGFIMEHPAGYLGQLVRDAGVFVLKSGMERIVIDYLEFATDARDSLQEEGHGWRSRLEQMGPVGLLKWLVKEHPTVLIPSAIGAVFFAALWMGAAYGIYGMFRRWRQLNRPARLVWLVMALLPAYVFIVSQVVDAMQSRHRAPAEFALCLFAAVALHTLRRGDKATIYGAREMTVAATKSEVG